MIKKFASWNGYPKNVVNAIIKRVLSKETLTNDVISNEEKDKIPTVFINIDCPGGKGQHVTRADSAIQGHLDNCLSVEHFSLTI